MANNKDLWLEARKRSRPNWAYRQVFKLQKALAGKVASQSLLNAENRAIIVDLSSWNPNVNVEGLIDAGVNQFYLRCQFAAQYVEGNFMLTEDTTYRGYYDRIRTYAKKVGKQVHIGAYFIYISGVEQEDFANSTEYTSSLALIFGAAYKPDLIIIDDEVDAWYRGSTKIYSSPNNQVTGLIELRRKLWNRFRLPIMHYSARWFINKYLSLYTTMYDNANKPESIGGPGKTLPTWYAWYPLSWTDVFANVRDVIAKILTPTATQENTLLSAPGSYTGWELWQFTDRLITPYYKLPNGTNSGLDFSISRQPLAQYNAMLGLPTQIVTPPTPDPDPEPEPEPEPSPDLEALRADLQALTSKVTALTSRVDKHLLP